MRFFLAFILTMALAWLLGLWLPYWSLSLAAMLIGFLVQPGAWKALFAGLLAGVLLWGGLAYSADAANTQILATRVGALFGTSAAGMVGITAVLGALLAGLGTLLGDRIRDAVAD
jgi:hypothetical protein